MRPSLRLRFASLGMRVLARPFLELAKTPEKASRDLLRSTHFLHRPAFLRHHERPLGGVPTHFIAVGEPARDKAILWLHGGGFVSGSGVTHLGLLGRLAKLTGVEVVAPDYRLLPDGAFPRPLDDALASWDGLRERGLRPRDIALGGDSSGAGLAMALLAILLARGDRPAALHALCPWADLTLSGRSLLTNGRADPMIPVRRLPQIADLYLAGADPRDPRASPIFADFPDAPPALIQAGDREAFLSDAERAAARLRSFGAEVVLEVWPGAPHDWPMLDGWVPESRAALVNAARFLRAAFDAPAR